MAKKKKRTSPSERIELWADLLRDEYVITRLPVRCKTDLIGLCLKAYKKSGYEDEYENPFFVSEKYASPRWPRIVNEAASGSSGVFIKCVRERTKEGFDTQWKKVYKPEYIKQMAAQAGGIATRIENYTYNKELAQNRWKNLMLPGFEVLQLPQGR